MKIAICDDDIKFVQELQKKLTEYRTPVGKNVETEVFDNALELLYSMEKEKYDVLLLDILMPGMNGMETAHDIRKVNGNIPIVFLTSSPEFAVESYRVDAFDYLLKPIDEELLFRVLNKISVKTEDKEEKLMVETSKEVFSLQIQEIEYLEINNRRLVFHMADGIEKIIMGRMIDYEKILLDRPEFVKVHRSFIVNLDRMQKISVKEFISLTGKEIPISRNLVKDVREVYIERLHNVIRIP